jgi:hypothetical protein
MWDGGMPVAKMTGGEVRWGYSGVVEGKVEDVHAM